MDPQPQTCPQDTVEAFRRRYQTGLVTLLFTDMVGSTALKQQLGDGAAADFFRKHHALVRETLRQFSQGEEIETAGDSFLIIFATPSDAVRFALVIQNRLRGLMAGNQREGLDRIGIHVGEVVVSKEADSRKPRDLFGIQIDTCARVMSLAQGGQVLMTRAVFDSARQALKGEDICSGCLFEWLNHGPYLLKGLEEPVEICEVREQSQLAAAPPPNSDKVQRLARADDEPVLGWRPAVGQLVPNTRWALERKLGEGGFGEVWLGRNPATREARVFKFCFQADRVRFLKRELTLFRLLKERVGDHPNIVRLHDVMVDQPPFYVELDYVHGADLRNWCEQHGGVESIPLATRLEIAAQVADALQAAHDAGVIHRDVKPTNILIGDDRKSPAEPEPPWRHLEEKNEVGLGIADSQQATPESRGPVPTAIRVKLTDFGIGQVVSDECFNGITRAGFTQTLLADSASSHSGTHLYMAPELLAGKPASTRSDIYSLGVVIYQLCVGDLTRPLTTDWARDISDPLLREDLKNCFAGNPQDRFAAAGLLARNLRALPQRQARWAREQSEEAARMRAAYRRGMMRVGAVATLVLLGMAALTAVALNQRSLALAQERSSRHVLYAAQVNLAGRAWQDGNIAHARELLLEQRPRPGQPDLRGFEWRFHWQFCRNNEIATLHGHVDLAQSVAVSPDSQLLVSGDMDPDGLVHIWKVAERRELIAPLRLGANVRCVAFSHDGKQVAAGGFNGKVKLWQTDTWREVAAFEAQGSVERLAFSSNGQWLAAGVAGPEPLLLWKLSTSELVRGFRRPAYERPCVAFSPDSRLLACGLGDKTVILFDATTQRELRSLKGHEGFVVHVEFSPDGKLLASASEDSTVKLWDVADGREVGALLGHKARVTSVAFSPDGKTLATSCADATIKLWDLASRKELAILTGHTNWVNNVVFLPDGTLLASASDDKTIKLWDARPGARTQSSDVLVNGVADVQMDRSRKTCLTIGTDNSLTVWKMGGPTPPTTLLPAGNSRVAARLSSDGRSVTIVEENGGVRLLDVATGELRQEWTTSTSGLRDTLWDAATRKSMGAIKDENFDFLVNTADGRTLAVKYNNTSIRLWDVIGQRLAVAFTAEGRLSGGLVLSDNSELAAHGTEEGKVLVWKVATGESIGPLAGHVGQVFWLRFSTDGKTLASGSYDNTARLWNLEHRQEIATLRGHSGWVTGLDFSRDGKTLATASNDGTIKLWSLSSFREVATLPGHIAIFSRLYFTADDQSLLCTGEDKSLRIWRAPPPVSPPP